MHARARDVRRNRGCRYHSAGRTPATRTASATRSSGTPSNGPLMRSGQSSAAAAKSPQSEYTGGHCTAGQRRSAGRGRDHCRHRRCRPRFPSLDAAIIVAYLAVLTGVGVYFSRRQRSLDEYFLARQSMTWLPVGLSLMAALDSAIDYLMQPSSTIKYGLILLIGTSSWLFLYPWVAHVTLPFYRRLNYYTAYEYLEARFDVRVRSLAAGIFIVWRLGLDGDGDLRAVPGDHGRDRRADSARPDGVRARLHRHAVYGAGRRAGGDLERRDSVLRALRRSDRGGRDRGGVGAGRAGGDLAGRRTRPARRRSSRRLPDRAAACSRTCRRSSSSRSTSSRSCARCWSAGWPPTSAIRSWCSGCRRPSRWRTRARRSSSTPRATSSGCSRCRSSGWRCSPIFSCTRCRRISRPTRSCRISCR